MHKIPKDTLPWLCIVYVSNSTVIFTHHFKLNKCNCSNARFHALVPQASSPAPLFPMACTIILVKCHVLVLHQGHTPTWKTNSWVIYNQLQTYHPITHPIWYGACTIALGSSILCLPTVILTLFMMSGMFWSANSMLLHPVEVPNDTNWNEQVGKGCAALEWDSHQAGVVQMINFQLYVNFCCFPSCWLCNHFKECDLSQSVGRCPSRHSWNTHIALLAIWKFWGEPQWRPSCALWQQSPLYCWQCPPLSYYGQ